MLAVSKVIPRVVGFAAIHGGACWYAMIVAHNAGGLNSPLGMPTQSEKLVAALYEVLKWPILPICIREFGGLVSGWGEFIIFFLNGLLWGACIFAFWYFLFIRRRQHIVS